MSGNIMEWCQDWLNYGAYTPQIDPVGPSSPDSIPFLQKRICRGGAYVTIDDFCSVSDVYGESPMEAYPYTGMRLVLIYHKFKP